MRHARLNARPLACLLLLVATGALARERLNFNPDWKFIKADPPGVSRRGFDDSTWTSISTPHTFNDVDTFDDWSPPAHTGETNQWSGRTWYRKSFVLPEAYRGERVFIEFEAVRQVAEVYLNGEPLGTNCTGFIPFGFELTKHLRFDGATNVLAVMADNRFTLETELSRIASTELPWNSPHWHPAHGGIYRNVYLHVTDPLHITLPLYSGLQTAGPYIYSINTNSDSVIHCEIPVQNDRPGREQVLVTVEILDHSGEPVLRLNDTKPIDAGSTETFRLSGVLSSPRLWDPSYPYLYNAVCSVSQSWARDRSIPTTRDTPVDSCEIPFGIRTVKFDSKTGFYINGRHLKMHGWGQRPTSEWPGLGAAQPDWMHYYTLQLMREAGGNFVRWGHCAGAPADITSADQLGLLVLQPGVDGEGDAKGDAWTLRASAFRDMLIYFRNHPSIIIWEGGNQKVLQEHARELRQYVNTYDLGEGRAYAHRRADEITGEFMDVDIGTEGGRQVPRLPVVEGEYDREESPRRVWDDSSPPNFGYPEAKAQTYQLTSEQYAINQISQYVTKLGAPYHCGGANWLFSDTTSGGRVGCEVARAGGEVDGMRLPKEAYFVCRTMFRSDPQVHIIGHWSYPPGTRKTVYVASNCETVELFLNGKSLDRGKNSDRYLFSFPEIAWEPGELKAVAYHRGKTVALESKHTVGAPVGLRLTSIVGPRGLRADGSDVALIDVEAVDTQGDRCPTFQQRVDFDVAGPGLWRGGYNSGKPHSINNRFLDLECGINRVAVRATRVAGAITVTALCSGLKSGSVTFASSAESVSSGCSSSMPALPAVPALVAMAADNQIRLPDIEIKPAMGRYLKAFTYSGPAAAVAVKENAREGEKIYVDRDFIFRDLPEALRGCDWVQTANADKLYSAVDLIDLSPAVDSIIYLVHDGRLPVPEWLRQQFHPTGLRLSVNGQPMKVYERALIPSESLTLGANTEDARLKSCNMYIVFVKSASQR